MHRKHAGNVFALLKHVLPSPFNKAKTFLGVTWNPSIATTCSAATGKEREGRQREYLRVSLAIRPCLHHCIRACARAFR